VVVSAGEVTCHCCAANGIPDTAKVANAVQCLVARVSSLRSLVLCGRSCVHCVCARLCFLEPSIVSHPDLSHPDNRIGSRVVCQVVEGMSARASAAPLALSLRGAPCGDDYNLK